MKNKFTTIIEQHRELLKKDTLLFNAVGYFKLAMVVVTCVLLYFIFVQTDFVLWLVVFSAAVCSLLIVIWLYHIKLNERMDYSKGIIEICNQHIDRITGKWTSFKDTGEEFADSEHPYAHDLDIVGNNSLFKFINTANTWHGRQRFAADLLNPSYSTEELRRRQKAVSELSDETDFACKIQYYLSMVGSDVSAIDLVNGLKNKEQFIKNKLLKFLLTYAPVVTFILIIGSFIFQFERLQQASFIIVAIQTLIWVVGIPKTQLYLGDISHVSYKLSAYGKAIEILNTKKLDAEKLTFIKERLLAAEEAFKALGKIADKVNMKHNGILFFLLNTFLLWDYFCIFQLEEWKMKYSDLVENWFEALGEFEGLLCLSNLSNVCEHTCLPVFAGENKTIKAKQVGHPLLSDDVRINNDFLCENNIFIISGSNMSGKTTFLRTIGINIVLSCAGGFVCAEQMSLSHMKLITSMRISDDLREGVSTFYAELRRIKTIIDLAEKESDMMFLIDEIFRGTNSIDRLSAARTVLSKLNELGAVGMISTHDLELCNMSSSDNRILNFNFSEQYENDKISFDYKLRPGKSNTTNAEYLMRMVGILLDS